MHINRPAVVIGVIEKDQKFLIAQRQEGQSLPGYWEFPGGKCKPHESIAETLRRELHEEIGIRVQVARPLFTLNCENSYQSPMRLHAWKILRYRGTPRGREGQTIQWVHPSTRQDLLFPPPNAPIWTAAQLPDVYAITPPDCMNPSYLNIYLEHVIAEGIRLIQLRLETPTPQLYLSLVQKAHTYCQAHQAKLILKHYDEWVSKFDFDGLHLTTQELMSCDERPIPTHKCLAASCHNKAELEHAQKIGVDFATLSSIKPSTKTKHEAELGWTQFEEWANDCTIPLYAMGGLNYDDQSTAWEKGAQGIAGIRFLLDQC